MESILGENFEVCFWCTFLCIIGERSLPETYKLSLFYGLLSSYLAHCIEYCNYARQAATKSNSYQTCQSNTKDGKEYIECQKCNCQPAALWISNQTGLFLKVVVTKILKKEKKTSTIHHADIFYRERKNNHPRLLLRWQHICCNAMIDLSI